MKANRVSLIFFLASVATYHAVSLWSSHSRGTLVSPPPPTSVPLKAVNFKTRSEPYAQPSSKAIGGVGYALRYFGGQLPEILMGGDSRPLQIFALARESAFQFPESSSVENFKNIDVIATALEKAGIRVVILPLPTKVSIERDRFPDPLPPSSLFENRIKNEKENPSAVYSTFLDRTGGRGIDLFRLFLGERMADLSSPLYPPFDFHWSSRAIALTTASVLQKLQRLGIPGVPAVRVEKTSSVPLSRPLQPFHIVHYLQLPPWIRSRLPQFRWAEPLYSLRVVSPASVPFTGRVVLGGTSNCLRHDGTEYSLEALLRGALQISTVNHCVSGGAATGWMRSMVQQSFHFQRGDLFIWEVTEIEVWDLAGSPAPLLALLAPTLPPSPDFQGRL